MAQQYIVRIFAVMIIACFGFFSVACGVTTLGSQTAGTPSTPTATTASPAVPSQGATVTLVLSKTSYAVRDTIDITIQNDRASSITPTGQHTSCTPLILEYLAGGSWQPLGECQTLMPAPITEIPAGTSVAEHLRPTNARGPTNAWAAGTYRVRFEYYQGDSASSGAMATAQSSQFTVG